MLSSQQFDLAAYLRERFPSLTLGGGLLYRWRLGIRFELGWEVFRERAARLYEAVFSPEDTCVVISQDWPENISPSERQRYFPVFNLPGVFDPADAPRLKSPEIAESDEDEECEHQNFTLRWTQVPAPSFKYVAYSTGLPMRITPTLRLCHRVSFSSTQRQT
jgi:hypothetical protein